MSTKTITIHADELEYTSEGLRLTEQIELAAGSHNKIVIERPAARPAIPVGAGGFEVDSSFPTPVVLAALIGPSLDSLFRRESPPIYQVFGHASPDGNIDHNKDVADRRARMFVSLLVGEVTAAQGIAADEQWGPAEQQVMLRALHCDPGLIDGEHGPLTEKSVRDFQTDYNDGVFHAHTSESPVAAPLAVDGVLDTKTFEALVESYVVAFSPRVGPEQLHPTHPAAGCSEFNQLDPDAGARNRRVALVVHDELPKFHDRAPCTNGDASACPVDGEGPRRCLWYRSHVVDPPPDAPRPHFDLWWQPLAGGKVLLSALTTLEDGATVNFQVFTSTPVSGPEDIDTAALDKPVGEAIEGAVRLGVAQATTHSTTTHGLRPTTRRR